MPTMSQLDQPQVIKSVYDATNQALQVNVVATSVAAASVVKITDGAGGGENVTVTAANALKVDGSGVTQPVNVSQFAGSNAVTGTGASGAGIPRVTVANDSNILATQSGNWSVRNQDGAGNGLTSQASGGQRALDVGIDVAGVQVDPRSIRALTSSDTVTAVQPTGTNLHVVVDSGSIAATQSGNWSTRTQDGSGTAITSTGSALDVNLKTSSITVSQKSVGYTLGQFVRNDYSSVNVTTGAYVQLIASTSNTYEEFEIFDSSGQTLKIAFGGSGSEVDQFLVFPGGNGRILWHVPSGTRISIEAVSANATAGEFDLNLRG